MTAHVRSLNDSSVMEGVAKFVCFRTENGFYFSKETLPFPNICSQKINRTLRNS